MVFLNWKECPGTGHGFDMFWFAALMVVLVPGLLAFVFGWFRLPLARQGRLLLDHHAGADLRAAAVLPQRHRLRRQQRLHRLQAHPRLPDRHAGDAHGAVRAHRPRAGGFFLLRAALVTSKFGRVLQAIRDAESRVMFTGYDPSRTSSSIWTLSAVMCGIAGALYVPQVGIINPSEMSPGGSIEIAIWAAVGGRGTLIGPDRRRVLRQRRQELVHAGVPEFWLYFLGALFIAGDAVPAARHRRGLAQEGRKMLKGRGAAERAQARRTSRPRSGGRRRRAGATGELGSAHGAILYLDDITVSFDGFKALNALTLYDRRRRAALHHRPERRRQDHDDGRHHRQDPARRGHGVLRRTIDLLRCARTRSPISASAASSRSRRCSRAHGVREPRAGAEGRQAACGALFFTALTASSSTASARC
jgi:hypothetical protein